MASRKGEKSPNWDGSVPESIIAKIDRSLKRQSDGTLTVPGFGIDKLITYLRSAVTFDPQLSALDSHTLVDKAVISVAKAGKLEPGKLLSKLRTLQREFLDRPTQSFTVITNVTIKWGSYLRPRVLSDVTIRFRKSLPRKFDRSNEQQKAERRGIAQTPSECVWALIEVSAKSPAEAFTTASNALEVLCGFWNLNININQVHAYRDDLFAALNTIFAGPLYTLHSQSGTVVADFTWYEPNYPRGQVRVVDIGGLWEGLLAGEKKLKARLRNRDEREEFLSFIREYSAALNHSDMRIAFTGLWRCFERFTFTAKDERNTESVNRASFLFEEMDYHREVMNQLRRLRNGIVHQDQHDPHMPLLVEDLRMIVEVLLRFHIFNPYGLTDREAFRRFLSLSPEVDILQDEIRVRQKALRFRGHK